MDNQDKIWKCDKCYRNPIPAKLSLQGKEYVEGYGFVSRARLDELNRRVVLPYKKGEPGGGEYYLGRRGENGKIQEKHPNYYK